MAKETNITWRRGEPGSAKETGALLRNADENDLRVLSAVCLLSAEGETLSVTDLVRGLEMEPSEVEASLKFWRGAGVLQVGVAKKPKTAKEPEVPTPQPPAHRKGAVERSSVMHEYTSAELAELMEQRRVSADLVDEAQQIMGKIFRVYDTGILVGLVDQQGFAEEAVLAILAYAVRHGKKTMRYVERMALAFYDEGITDTADVLDKISRMEQSAETVGKIKQMFGVGSRELTATEKKLFTLWTETYGFDIEVIRLAYEMTVDAIQKPVPKYASSILESWYGEGLRKEADIRAYLEEKKADRRQESDGGKTPKSYDIEEFFEAALQRGLKDYQ